MSTLNTRWERFRYCFGRSTAMKVAKRWSRNGYVVEIEPPNERGYVLVRGRQP